MKKSLIALAALAATASFAQSTVTLYGVVDTGFRSVESGTNKFNGMANGSNATSRLGFKGTEDLGGGMKGNFVLEGDLAPNDGTAAGFRFLRQSTIGLAGNFGEVRLGRDYTPAFRVYGVVDPFGYVGVGSSGNLTGSTVKVMGAQSAQAVANATGTFQTPSRGTVSTSAPSANSAAILPSTITYANPNQVRANNTFAYYSPNFMGVTAGLTYSTGSQNTASEKAQGRMTGLNLTYANGPLTAAYANQVTKGGLAGALAVPASATLQPAGATCSSPSTKDTTNVSSGYQICNTGLQAGATATDNQKWTTNFLAGSYNFGVAKAALGYRTDKYSEATDSYKSMIYSASAPVGAVTLKASYITRKLGNEKVGNQYALGAVYDLSKRTALYATYAQLKNEAGYANTIGSALASTGGITSKGYDIGVRHSF